MTPLQKRLAWSVAIAAYALYSVFLGVRDIRHPRPQDPWFTPYLLFIISGLLFYSAIEGFRRRNDPLVKRAEKSLTRTDRIVFKALGALLAMIGLAIIAVGFGVGWQRWATMPRWAYTRWEILKIPVGAALFGLVIFVGAVLVFRDSSRR